MSPLVATFYRGGWPNLQILRLLVAAGADPNLNISGKSPLELAYHYCQPAAFQILLEHGAEPRSTELLYEVVTSDGTRVQKSEFVSLVLQIYRDRGQDPRLDATRALYSAASQGDIDSAIRLLQAGANVNGMEERALCAKHSTINCWCAECQTPIERAAQSGWADMVQLLINAGAEGHEVSSASCHVPSMVLPGDPSDLDEVQDLLEHAREPGQSGERAAEAGRKEKRSSGWHFGWQIEGGIAAWWKY